MGNVPLSYRLGLGAGRLLYFASIAGFLYGWSQSSPRMMVGALVVLAVDWVALRVLNSAAAADIERNGLG